MCRFTLYHGPRISLDRLITEPSNSLIHQSFQSQDREEPLNGDGFGVAWYAAGQENPARFRSVTPAWNNANLYSIARVVESGCVLAHVRAATQVRTVSEANCHPFVSGSFTFMHNGDVGSFSKIRRALLADLSNAAFDSIEGSTDSEHLFAVFLDEVAGDTAHDLAVALRRSFHRVLDLTARIGECEHSYLNVAVSNGRSAVITRFTTEEGYDGESLYLSRGRRFVCEDGLCRMLPADEHGAAVLVSSERLSDDENWEVVPRNHVVLIGADHSVELQAI
jgi:glutamine amidotransferase